MTKRMFLYRDKIGGFISVRLLHKPPKGNTCRQDIIQCRAYSQKNRNLLDFVMTPHEAVMLSAGILNAVTEYACTPTKRVKRNR